MVRLQVGFLASGAVKSSDTALDKEAIFVYPGTFQSMDGEVQVTLSHLEMLRDNHNSLFERVKRLASGEVPLRYMPPMQLDHSSKAMDTVGRIVGPLEVVEMDIDGAMTPVLKGTVRFLGRENVERATDGRFSHLSIGADLDTGKLNEISVTPFPAAPNASLLSRLADLTEEEKEARMGAVELPGKVNEALWDKAKDASKEAFGEVRWPFVTWWYKKQGGSFARMAEAKVFETIEYRGLMIEIYRVDGSGSLPKFGGQLVNADQSRTNFGLLEKDKSELIEKIKQELNKVTPQLAGKDSAVKLMHKDYDTHQNALKQYLFQYGIPELGTVWDGPKFEVKIQDQVKAKYLMNCLQHDMFFGQIRIRQDDDGDAWIVSGKGEDEYKGIKLGYFSSLQTSLSKFNPKGEK